MPAMKHDIPCKVEELVGGKDYKKALNLRRAWVKGFGQR